jgi:hypothetical protein
VLYLRDISTGDFQEALSALLGTDAPNLSPAVISRLTAEWKDEYTRWQKRDLSARHYVYAWADGGGADAAVAWMALAILDGRRALIICVFLVTSLPESFHFLINSGAAWERSGRSCTNSFPACGPLLTLSASPLTMFVCGLLIALLGLVAKRDDQQHART